MNSLPKNSSLLNDLYQFRMASVYFKEGIHEEQSTFDLFTRSLPKNWGYLIACGIDEAIDFIKNYTIEDHADFYLTNSKIISRDAASYLIFNMKKLKEKLSIRAVKEGTIIFPNEPVMTISGPRILCQLLETRLLNIINFQTLIASKASRMVNAAKGRGVIEFGLRRAHGEDAAIKGARAAYIGGCIGTSNVAAGFLYEIPIMGTHAHSMVLSIPPELEAFKAYARSFPEDTTLLIDTYDTLNGAKVAAIEGKELEKLGYKLKAVRLDSGDLFKLSNQVRTILNNAGLSYVNIVVSNDLNEFKIDQLVRHGAKIDSFGVGTELITGKPESALGGVYKLVEDVNGDKVKLSQDKKTMPGLKQIIRSQNFTDLVCLLSENEKNQTQIELLSNINVFNHNPKSASYIRSSVKSDVDKLPAYIKELEVPHEQRVIFSAKLLERESAAQKEAERINVVK